MALQFLKNLFYQIKSSVLQATISKAEETQIIPLKILVDEVRNKVVFAETDYSFVDVLFSFLTLPLGTIVRLINKNSDSTPIGCLNSLYEGLEDLPSQYFGSEEHKLMLLHPRNSSEVHCSQLKLNVDDSRYFICENWECSRQERYCSSFSIFNTKRCLCGKFLTREIGLRDPNVHPKGGVFVKEKMSFMITDDLCIMPSLPGSSIRLLGDLGITDMSRLEVRNVNIGLKEVLKLLELALVSRCPLSDLFLGKTTNLQHPVKPEPGYSSRPKNTKDSSATSKKMDVRAFDRYMSYWTTLRNLILCKRHFLTLVQKFNKKAMKNRRKTANDSTTQRSFINHTEVSTKPSMSCDLSSKAK